MSSISSTDLAAPGLRAGDVVAGFRVERELGRGRRAVVYEATQAGLQRRVALKLLEPQLAGRVRGLRWPDHPRVARMYAAGVCESGPFLAIQLVSGPSLGSLLSRRRLDPALARRALASVAEALDAAHAAGISHGSVGAGNVLIGSDERALLSDFGLEPAGATPAADRAAFAALVRECLGREARAAPDPLPATAHEILRTMAPGVAPPPGPRRDPRIALAAISVVAAVSAAGAAAYLVAGSGGGPATGPPAVIPGARALGSALAPGTARSVDCEAGKPSAESLPCTIVQTRLRGRQVVITRAGAVRRWTVRGATGDLALQVVRPRGRRFAEVARSATERVRARGAATFRTDLPVRPGDRLGLLVGPGGSIGVRRGARGATTARWLAPLTLLARPVDSGAGTGLDRELLLRAEYVPGARARVPGLVTGLRAARARAGRRLASAPVELPGGAVATAAVVRVDGRVALDLVRGGVRRARVPVAGADGGGRLASFVVFGSRTPQLDWRNPDGRVVHHDYDVGARSLAPRDRSPP